MRDEELQAGEAVTEDMSLGVTRLSGYYGHTRDFSASQAILGMPLSPDRPLTQHSLEGTVPAPALRLWPASLSLLGWPLEL